MGAGSRNVLKFEMGCECGRCLLTSYASYASSYPAEQRFGVMGKCSPNWAGFAGVYGLGFGRFWSSAGAGHGDSGLGWGVHIMV